MTAKKCTKKRDACAKLLFCLVKLLTFLLSRRRCILNFLLSTIHCDPSETEFSQCKLNCPCCWYHPKRFSTLPVVPSFLVRIAKWTNPGQLSRDNSRLVRTHEKNSGETVRRLGTIIQTIFCAQSGRSIRFTFWKWSGESRHPGALPPLLENFRRAFSPSPTDCLALFIKNLHYKEKRHNNWLQKAAVCYNYCFGLKQQ